MTTLVSVKDDKLKQIDEYLSELRPSKNPDPAICPRWSVCSWLWYCICFVFEIPLIIALETTYFLLTGYGYYKAKKKYKSREHTKHVQKPRQKLQSISIIVPCYNEASNIESLLLYIEKHCYNKNNVEIILIDGGSTDKWWDKINKNKKLLSLISIPINIVSYNEHKKSGRGICQNIAAQQYANNDIFIFLHADTIVCDRFDEIARNKINNNSDLLIGSWGFALDRGKMLYPLPGLLILEYRVNLKSRLFLCAWGDHGYFMTKTVFNNILNGMPNQCIMEDYHFSSNARNYALLNNKSIFIDNKNYFYTSPRKWYKSGRLWKNSLRNQYIVYLYEYCHYTPQQIYKIYYGVNLPESDS